MFLIDLRRRFKRSFPGRSGQQLGGECLAASLNRTQRAERVRYLQDEVHRLQIEIAEVSQTQALDTTGGERNAIEKLAVELQNELVETQRTLATLRGRI